MLFVRDFAGFTGGHLKFAHYLRHTATSGFVRPVLYQTPRSRTVAGNIFNGHHGPMIDEPRPFPAYFVAGMDWFRLDEAGIDPGTCPVVNLVQDFRGSDSNDPRFACLRRPALRICVSPGLADSIRAHANGDVHVVPNGIEVGPQPASRPLDRRGLVLIAGLKNPRIAREISALLGDRAEVDLITDNLPRPEFLARMALATVCILLPEEREGFFLPALEAMALGRGVVTPDCGGNRAYCRPEQNCLMPAYTAHSLADAAVGLLYDRARLDELVANGLQTASAHSLDQERRAYLQVLGEYLGRS